MPLRKYSESEKLKAVAYWRRTGATAKKIAEKFGMSESKIQKLLTLYLNK